MNRTRGALVHRLMHTSVEKHSLRVAESCGTLALFTNGISPRGDTDAGRLRHFVKTVWRTPPASAFLESQSTESPHACAVFLLGTAPRGSFARRWRGELLYNRLQSPHG